MKKLRSSSLEYPVVLRRVLNDIVISVPDLGYWKSIPIDPPSENSANSSKAEKMADLEDSFFQLTEELQNRILDGIKQTWVYIDDHKQNKLWVPAPSTFRASLQASDKEDFTLPEFTKRLNEHISISENTVRREIKRGAIQCYQTEGGHRRIPYQELELYLYRRKNFE